MRRPQRWVGLAGVLGALGAIWAMGEACGLWVPWEPGSTGGLCVRSEGQSTGRLWVPWGAGSLGSLCVSSGRESPGRLGVPSGPAIAGGPGGVSGPGRMRSFCTLSQPERMAERWGPAKPEGTGGLCGLFRLWEGRAFGAEPAEDPYVRYLRTAPEFQPVRQDPDVLLGRWKTWIYMPWRYQWTIGTDEEGGRFCQEYGINGGFTDHGSGPLAWLQKWNLLFYNDHTAGKGMLYLRGVNQKSNFARFQRDPRAIRSGTDGPQPIDQAMRRRLTELISRNIGQLKHSPMRVAYALDDEISWGAFVVPLPWRLYEDDADYQAWLDRYYGGRGPKAQYVTPDFILPQLKKPIGQLDFSPLLDRITFNDSVWATLIGQLVEAANRADPETPCGFVGAQSPNIWGGYDYAKLMKKVQFLEPYDLGSSFAIARSFSPGQAIPLVTTHFHNDQRGVLHDIWQAWYFFAHGSRGMIGWVEGWFDGKTPRPWLKQFSPTLKELGQIQGPKLVGARWLHDGVAIYYSHPSIQISWCLDMEAHGRTWVNRGNDHRLGTSHLVRKAWEYLLIDSGIQYNFIPYDQVATEGVPDPYKVLILPACYGLSDAEARRITEFCQRGGTVIADFACGLFDHHGKGRSAGALDPLFGVHHDGTETFRDFFDPNQLWVETNQDAAYYYKTYRELFGTLQPRLEKGFAVAERRLPIGTVRTVGRGRAVYLNLSPQRYLQYREEGTATEEHRRVFIEAVLQAGIRPWVEVLGPDGRRPPHCEVTYWAKEDRVYLFVIQSAPVTGQPTGNTHAETLQTKTIPLELRFAKEVADLVDERTGQRLGTRQSARFIWNPAEALLLSFRGGH